MFLPADGSRPEFTGQDVFLPPRFTLPWTLLMFARRLMYRSATNSPYLSGDSFASLVDFVPFGVDGNRNFSPDQAVGSRTFFVQADRLEEFETLGYQAGLRPSVVVTGNSDRNFETARPNPLGCDLWLAQNNAMPLAEGQGILPIGLENKRLGRLGLEKHYRRQISSHAENRVLVPPMRSTNPVRATVTKQAISLGDPFVFMKRYRQAPSYFRMVRQFRFLLCLEGNGFENHRVWEALYLGVFPVLLRTPWSTNLETLGLPLLIVERLQDIGQNTLDDFLTKHANFDPASEERLWVPFWNEVINSRVNADSPGERKRD